MRDHTIRTAAVLIAFAGLAGPALAQDSVSNATNVGGDALGPYATQTVRYVVDLSQISSMWGSSYAVAPILKASRDNDVLFNTLALGSAGVSADIRQNVSLGAPMNYSLWSSRGAGVGSTNTAAGSTSASVFGRQFGVGISDFNADSTNVIGALIGVQNDNITRLYVRRTVAVISRISAGSEDTGTVSFGSIDASGNTAFRADSFNGSTSNKVVGENIARVGITARGSGLNGIFKSGSNNALFDAGASTFLINNGAVTTNTPATLPASIAGGATTLLLNFANQYAVNAGAGGTTHLAAPIDSHRGNPQFLAITNFGGAGVVSAIGRSVAGGGLVDSINLTSVSAAGAVLSATSATLPTPLPGFPALNAAGDAQFLQYLSQVGFRGPNGLAAVGVNSLTGNPIGAATATDPTAGDFIAVAEFPGGTPTWTVAAYEGQPVKNGPAGAVVGALGTEAPASLSAPAADLLGNIYFVGVFDPTVGAPVHALFKAVKSVSGYNLELLLKEGDAVVGANSATPYTIESIALGDSDSIASAGFNAGQLLAQQIPGHTTTDPGSPFAATGLIVNATITYNNLGTAESYEATLFLGPYAAPAPSCAGDLNGDGFTNSADFNILASNFGAGPGASFAQGDLSGDGFVNSADFNILAGDFGCGS